VQLLAFVTLVGLAVLAIVKIAESKLPPPEVLPPTDPPREVYILKD
jgi:hypothetical protein